MDGIRARERLLQDITSQLAALMKEQEFAAYENSENEILAELRLRVDAAFKEFGTELSSILDSELEQRAADHNQTRQRRYLWITMGLMIAIALYAAVTVPLRYNKVITPTLYLHTALSVFWITAAAVAFALISLTVSVNSVDSLPAARLAKSLRLDRERATRQYQARLKIFVAEQMRLIIPALPESSTRTAFLEHSSALVELAIAEPVSTSALASVRQFVKNHKASAIGLAGPRGVGKTTILSHLANKMDRTLGAYVPAPVRYEPNELLMRIFEELAIRYLGTGWQQQRHSRQQWRRRAVTLMLGAYLLLGMLGGGIALLIDHPQLKMNLSRWLGVFLVASSIAIVLFGLKRQIDSRRERFNLLRQESPMGRAEAILKNLRWQQERTSTLSVGVEPWGGLLKLGSEKSTTSSEREAGRPQLIADLHDFIGAISESDRFDRIVVALDELDKLASTDDLIAVVNEIKDILHIEGVHVIVSVSHDALDRFVLRGLPARDVFDSAFDEVIQLPLLNAEESVEVLRKRAVGFPPEWALACYVLSGGLPRDLLRFGRRCVDIYLARNDSMAEVIPQLIGEVAAERVVAELDAKGVASRLTAHGRIELEAAIETARSGSIADVVNFIDALAEDKLSNMLDWLDWLMEARNFASIAQAPYEFRKAEFLAKRGALAYSGRLRW